MPLIFLFILVLTNGCNIIKGFQTSVDDATQIVDNGIADINQNGAMWADILQRVSRELPEDVAEVIRDEAQSLATRSIAHTGTEIKCSVDFLGRRAKQGLQRIKKMILFTSKPKPLPPALCLVAPPAIDLNTGPSSWDTVTIHGYDLDHRDSAGNLIGYSLEDENQFEAKHIPEPFIGRTTHYQITLNLRELADTLHNSKISKIVPRWEDKIDGTTSGEIVVKAWKPATDTKIVDLGKTTFVPPHVGGDRDFDTGGNDPMNGAVSGGIKVVDESFINGHIFMQAIEQKGDHTHAKGNTTIRLWDSPRNWKIIRVAPQGQAGTQFSITRWGLHTYNQSPGLTVTRFNVYGDHDGDDAGGYTKVEVDWSTVSIDLEETQPSWIKF